MVPEIIFWNVIESKILTNWGKKFSGNVKIVHREPARIYTVVVIIIPKIINIDLIPNRILTTHPLISSSIACVWNGFLLFFVPHFWQNCCFLRLMRSVANSLEHTTQQYRELSSTKTRSRAKRMMTNATKYYFHPRFSLCTIDKNTNHIQKKKRRKRKKRESYSLQLTRSQLPGRRDKQLVDNVWNLQADQMQWSTVWTTCKQASVLLAILVLSWYLCVVLYPDITNFTF